MSRTRRSVLPRTLRALAPAAALLAAFAAPALAFPQPPEKKQETASAAAADSAAAPDAADSTAGGATFDAWSAAASPADSAMADSAAAARRATADGRKAEDLYAKGYDDARRGADLLRAGKEKDARKRFARALERFEAAVRLDDRYFEAWNMVGYCARQTGDLTRSFDAYDRCLALNPEYAAAHEYRGEAYLMRGEIAKAKEELAWLTARSSPLAATLEAAIGAKEKGTAGDEAPGGW
ncbi:MAG: tetratricopeptide repeat protein [Hyphomicrobiales bacterium]